MKRGRFVPELLTIFYSNIPDSSARLYKFFLLCFRSYTYRSRQYIHTEEIHMNKTAGPLPYDDAVRTALIAALDGIESDRRQQHIMLEKLDLIAKMQIPSESFPAVLKACAEVRRGLDAAMQALAHASDLDWSFMHHLRKVAAGVVEDLEHRPQ